MPQYDVISFLSDMGTADESVGVCKAIMHQQAPHANIIDITHEVAPFDVRAGALALTRAIQFLPKGVVVAAVDPGSPRGQRYIVVELEEGVLIGPDNGILAPAAQLIGQPKRVFEITNEEFRIDAPGQVFAARDILAPAAGVIAAGTDISELGNAIPLEQLVPGMLQLSRHDEGGALLGEVWSVDRFGNIQINITPEELEERNTKIGDMITIRVGNNDFMAKYVERYADLAVSQVGVLVDSTGMISIVKNLDYATVELGTREGKEIILLPQGTSVTGRDVTIENVAQSQPNASIEDAAHSLTQGLVQTHGAPPAPTPPVAAAPVPDAHSFPPVTAPPAEPTPFAPMAQPEPAAPPAPTPPAPPAEHFSPPPSDPFGSMPPTNSGGPFDSFAQPIEEPPVAPPPTFGSDPFASQPAPSDPFAQAPQPQVDHTQTPTGTSGYLSGPAPTGPIPVPGDPFAYMQPEPQAPPEPVVPTDFPFSAPPEAPTTQWGVPAEPQSSPAPVIDSPASYFPPPVEDQPPVTPDVAPTYDQPYGGQPQADSLPEGVPENVFDLFKVVSDDEDNYTDPDSEDTRDE